MAAPGKGAGRVPTGFAAETFISDHTFRQGHRAIEGGQNVKKRKREGKGDSGVVTGAGAYKGPWARYEEERPDAASDDEFGSDEEVEIVYEEDEIKENPEAPQKKLAGTDYHDTEAESETTEFKGTLARTSRYPNETESCACTDELRSIAAAMARPAMRSVLMFFHSAETGGREA